MDQPAEGPAEQRWRAALRLADGQDAGELAARRLHRYRVLVFALLAVLVLVAVAVVVVALHRDGPPRPRAAVPEWRQVLGLAVSVVGLLIGVVAVVRLLRGGGWRASLASPLRALDRSQRRLLLRQVRGTAPVEPARLPLTRELARQLERQRWVVVIVAGNGLNSAGQALSGGRSSQVGLAAAFAVLLAVGAPLAARDVRRARVFLARHPPQVTS